jgi:hypothetical protein
MTTVPRASRVPSHLALVAFAPVASALAVYGLTLCRTVYFGDSGELCAAATVHGIAHPPGYPLYTLLGRILVAILPGEPAIAVNLLSAFAAALAAGSAATLARLLGARPPAAIAAGLLVLGSGTLWSQAVVAEVYTLHAFLATAVLAALAWDERLAPHQVGRGGRAHSEDGDARALLVAAYLFALGLAHHLTIVHLALPALILLAARRRFPLPALPAAMTLAALALTLYATLLLRSRFDPPLDWGNPETLARLLDHVRARQYQFLLGKMRGPDMVARLGAIAGVLARDLSPALVPAMILGAIALRARRAWLVALALVVATLVAHAVAYGIPDYEGHLGPAFIVLAVLAALGLDLAARPLRPVPLAALLVLAIALAPLATHFASADRSTHRSAREFGANLLVSLPPGATIFAEGDHQVFLLAYLTAACGERPDVTVIDRDGNLFADFYGVRAESGRISPADFQRHRLATEVDTLDAWFAADPRRPVYTSARTTLPQAGRFVQEVTGIVFRVRPHGAAGTTPGMTQAGDPGAPLATTAIRRDAPHGDRATREVAARYWVRRGEAAFERGDRTAMAAAFDSALAIAPGNADLASYLGAFHGQNGMVEVALPLLRAAVAHDPLSVRGWTNLGFALLAAGRRDEGRAALEESLRIQPAQDEVAAVLSRLDRTSAPGRRP